MDGAISVVIPSYAHGRFLGDAMRSVFRQTRRPSELIVVDDGSTDGSPELARQLSSEAPFEVRLIEQPNQGAPVAIERGLAAATGEVLAILNSDDVYHPERLAELVPRLSGPRALAFSDVELVDEAGDPLPASHGWPSWYRQALREVESCPAIGYGLLLHNVSVTSGNFVFTRGLYEAVGGFSRHRFVHDWDFLLRAVYYAEPAWVRKRLMSYRIHGSNTTASVRDSLFEEALEALERYLGLCAGGNPPNPLAPCPVHWPRYFPEFVARHCPFFAPDRPLSAFVGSDAGHSR